MDKKTLMEHFDRIVTDPRLHLSQLQEHLAQLSGDEYYLGEYRVLTTAGSSGQKGVFVYSRSEWSTLQAAGIRIGALTGVVPFTLRRPRSVTVGAASPLHLSRRLAISLDTGLYHVKLLPATIPIEDLVQQLNTFQPHFLEGYPSMLALLVAEQLQGCLHISPRIICTSGEALTKELRQRLRAVWRCSVFDVYGTTEGLFAAECSFGGGMHLFEDLGLVEVVDERNCPVPDGTPGHKILFTSLFSFTQPVIRYEISDMVALDPEPCPCGRPLRRISSINGRSDDILYLRGQAGGQVAVHPIHFWDVLESCGDIRQYQVVHEPDGIHLRLVFQEGKEGMASSVRELLAQQLHTLGVYCPPIHVELVTTLGDRSHNMGKRKNIISNLTQPTR